MTPDGQPRAHRPRGLLPERQASLPSALPSDEKRGMRPREFQVVEPQAHKLRDAEPGGEAEIQHRLVTGEDPAVLRDADILGEAFYHAHVADASDVAEYLIQNGAAYTAIRYSGLSIHALAFSRRKTDYFDMPLRQDVGQNDLAYQAIPVLWMSLSRFRTDPGLIEIAAELLEKGANPNAQTQSGEHALHEAVFAGNPPIIRLLLERGADPNLPNNSGVTALTSQGLCP